MRRRWRTDAVHHEVHVTQELLENAAGTFGEEVQASRAHTRLPRENWIWFCSGEYYPGFGACPRSLEAANIGTIAPDILMKAGSLNHGGQ